MGELTVAALTGRARLAAGSAIALGRESQQAHRADGDGHRCGPITSTVMTGMSSPSRTSSGPYIQ